MIFNPRTAIANIEINRRFATEHADTPLRMSTLILHELFHHMLHHFVLYPSDRITNIAQDTLINALICRLAPSFQQLFNDIYPKTEFPYMLLRPGANLKRIQDENIREAVRPLYRRMYRKANRSLLKYYHANPGTDPDTTTVDDISTILLDVANKQQEKMKDNLANSKDEMDGLGGMSPDWFKEDSAMDFLGSHGLNEDGSGAADPFDSSELEEDKLNNFRELLEDLVRDVGSSPNASGLFKKSFAIEQDQAPDELVDAMNAALREDIMRVKQIVEGVVGPRKGDRSVVPRHIGRKETLLLAAGLSPLFYPAWTPEEQHQGDVSVYLDVSGSMGDQAPFLLMLLTAFKQQVATEFYQFSTVIAEVNFGEFLAKFQETGEVFMKTTGGTSFDPIFQHAEKKGHKKILILTDGMANVGAEAQLYAESIETFTVFTEQHQSDPLEGLSQNTWIMPRIDIKK